jgi:Ricin-type beta-trefoil lectin domain-like
MPHLHGLLSRRVVALIALVVAMAVAAVSAASASALTPGKYRITTGATGFTNVLDAAGDFNDYGTPVINWPSHGGLNQQWYIEQISATPGGKPAYQISSVRDPHFCLDVSEASQADGALVGLWSCNFQFNQQFFYRENPNKTGSFIARHSGKALTMPFGTGHQMFQYKDVNAAIQQFQFHRLD